MTIRELFSEIIFWLSQMLNTIRYGSWADLTIGQFVFLAFLFFTLLGVFANILEAIQAQFEKGKDGRDELMGCGVLVIIVLLIVFLFSSLN